jgi:hypothetical protein
LIVGVDFDTYKATMVGLPLLGEGGPVVETVVFRHKSGDDHAYRGLARVRSLLLASELVHQGDVFFIERGWGAQRKADYLMGAYFGVIYSFLSSFGFANVITAQEWKKAISAAGGARTRDGGKGRGNLTKLEAHVFVDMVAEGYGHDLSGWGADAIDAYAIATTGKWLNTAAASAIMGGMPDERDSRTPVEDTALRGAAGSVAAPLTEGGD